MDLLRFLDRDNYIAGNCQNRRKNQRIMALGKTARYYHSAAGRASYKKKIAPGGTDSKVNSRPSQIKKRSQLVKANRDRGDYGNGDGKDLHHAKNGKLVKMKASTNRGKTGEGGRIKGKSHKKGYRAKMKKTNANTAKRV